MLKSITFPQKLEEFINMKVEIVNKSNNAYPRYETSGSAGIDLRANLNNEEAGEYHETLAPGEMRVIGTGLYMSIPEGYEGQIRSRSGLAAKQGIAVLNSPGTIDSDYRGEIMIILVNHGTDPVMVRHGDRIAQMVFTNYERAHFDRVETLDKTSRGDGGLGHTGVE